MSPSFKIKDRVVLITGGTGSFGQALTRELLDRHNPRALLVFSRDELKQDRMRRRFDDPRLRFILGDIRDSARLNHVCRNVDIVFHAAALKQVNTCEDNPYEAVLTNIMGVANLVQAAIEQGIGHVISISTDKAAHPVNLYGATKLCAERILIQANRERNEVKPQFACIRFGNFLGSRGSVVPLFFEQRQQAQLTVTDRRMTRFATTPRHAAEFAVRCLNLMHGGEIFVPCLPSVRIEDLARVLAPEAELREVGLRPGEKLHETLITAQEAVNTSKGDGLFIIATGRAIFHQPEAEAALKDFSYTSETNEQWLDSATLAEWLRDLAEDSLLSE